MFQDAFRAFNGTGIFWVDSSVRFLSNNIAAFQNIALCTDGVCAFGGAGHSVFSTTPPEMFRFLPMVKDRKKEECLAATYVLLYRTKFVIDNVLHWWIACSLSRTCIYSEPNRFCRFTKDKWNNFDHCSRYDQSALSIILYNAFTNLPQIHHVKTGIINVVRGGRSDKVKNC